MGEQPLKIAKPRITLCFLPRMQTCCLRLAILSSHLPSILQALAVDRRIQSWSLHSRVSNRATAACQQSASWAQRPGTLSTSCRRLMLVNHQKPHVSPILPTYHQLLLPLSIPVSSTNLPMQMRVMLHQPHHRMSLAAWMSHFHSMAGISTQHRHSLAMAAYLQHHCQARGSVCQLLVPTLHILSHKQIMRLRQHKLLAAIHNHVKRQQLWHRHAQP